MSRTLEQRRAKYALDEIMKVSDKDNKFKKKYATYVSRTPTMILQNGLGQALAFLLSKSSGDKPDAKAAKKFYEQIECWLCGTSDEEHPSRIYSEDKLIEKLMAGDRREYMRAQVESLALLNWMKKFTDAYLPKESDNNASGNQESSGDTE